MLNKHTSKIRAIIAKARKTWFTFYLKALPVKKNTVFYHAYRNRIMSCNPYAIFLELIHDPDFKHFQHYWVYDSEDALKYDTFHRHRNMPNVHYVKASTPKHLQAIATCEYLINNAAMPDYWTKKKGQIYINTWHGTPLKMLGKFAKDFKESSIVNARRNFLIADYLVMPNRYTIEKILDSYDISGLVPGKILDAGYPRNDLPLNTDSRRIKTLLEIKLGEPLGNRKIVLYAPTFRSENGISLDTSDIAIEYIEEMLSTMPEEYVLFFKIHNTLGKFFRNNQTITKRLLFDEIDTNELLSATDVLITDYSSIFFDFLATKRPCLFFVYDRAEYEKNRGLYLEVSSLPGALCYHVSDIIQNLNLILKNQYNYADKEHRYLEQFAYNDDGLASKRVVNEIFRKVSIDNKYVFQDDSEVKNILIHCGEGVDRNKLKLLRYYLSNNNFDESRIFIEGSCLPDFQFFDEFAAYSIKILDQQTSLREQVISHLNEYVNISCDDIYNAKKYLDRSGVRCSALCYYRESMQLNDINTSFYSNISLVCSDSAECNSTMLDGLTPITHEAFAKVAEKTMTFLFIAGADSMNYVYVECIKEIKSRGHNAIVVVQNEKDEVNNKPFNLSGIDIVPIRYFDLNLLEFVDIVFTPPVKFKAYKRLYEDIKARSILMVAFSNLFSSVAMRVYPDILFAIGENKHREMSEYHLKYNTVFIGNPQYDPLIRSRREHTDQEIRKVIIIDQGGYPYGEKGKKQFGDILINIARNNPSIQFDIKPRYGVDEKGIAHHSVNEQLVDFIQDAPTNLAVLQNNTILEELIIEYDAMIATWSTAYMAAAMLNIPILLIEGFDSQDVFDVRNQRVDEAYNHLKNTGCLTHFTKLKDNPILFKYIDEAYLEKEIYHYMELSAPKVIDFLECYNSNFLKQNLGIYSDIVIGADEFFENWKSFPTKLMDDKYQDERRYRERLNDLMQEAVYINRCMANVLNLDTLDSFYNTELIASYIRDYGRDTSQLVIDFKLRFAEIKKQYFTNPTNHPYIEQDIILQDYYLDWLYVEKNFSEIFNSKVKISAITSLEYYKALALLPANKRKSYYHLNNYLRLLTEESGPQKLLKEKRVSSFTKPFRSGAKKILFYYFLLKHNNMNAITFFPENVTRSNPFLTFLLMLDNNRIGNHDQAIEIYNAYLETIEDQILIRQKNQKKHRSAKQILRSALKKAMNIFIRKEYYNARKHAI